MRIGKTPFPISMPSLLVTGWKNLVLFVSCYIQFLKYVISTSIQTDTVSDVTLKREKTIFFVVQNKNHVQIFADLNSKLRSVGVDTQFVVLEYHHLSVQAVTALNSRGYTFIPLAIMKRKVTPNDLVCVAVDWAPKFFSRAINRMKARGIRFIGMIDGARFLRSGRYKLVDHLLSWGPSGGELGVRSTFVVGSSVIERKLRLRTEHKRTQTRVLINYKRSDKDEQRSFQWGRAAIAAAKVIDPEPFFSVHPSVKNIPPSVVKDHRSVDELFSFASLLITRGSTLIYEALAAGVAVIYFPEQNEKRVEFADPSGAFMIANNAEQVVELAQLYAKNPVFPKAAADAFLARHVSIDPERTAEERSFEILLQVLQDAEVC